MHNSVVRAKAALVHLLELAMGGTAVGTGLNAHPQFAQMVADEIAQLTGMVSRLGFYIHRAALSCALAL